MNRDFKKLTPLKILTQEQITQTSAANSEHKHSKIERFSTLNKQIITQNSKDSVTVSCQ